MTEPKDGLDLLLTLGSGSTVTFHDGRPAEGYVFDKARLRFYLDGEEVDAETYLESTVTYVVEVRRGNGEIVSIRPLDLLPDGSLDK